MIPISPCYPTGMKQTSIKERMAHFKQLLEAIGLRSEYVLQEVYAFGVLLQQEDSEQAKDAELQALSEMQISSAEALLDILRERSIKVAPMARTASGAKHAHSRRQKRLAGGAPLARLLP